MAEIASRTPCSETRSVDYSLLTKSRFLVSGAPWQGLEKTHACTVSFSGGSLPPAVGRIFSQVVAPAVFFLLRPCRLASSKLTAVETRMRAHGVPARAAAMPWRDETEQAVLHHGRQQTRHGSGQAGRGVAQAWRALLPLPLAAVQHAAGAKPGRRQNLLPGLFFS